MNKARFPAWMSWLGWITLALVGVHYAMDIHCVLRPPCSWDAPVTMRFACLCPIALGVVSLAAILGSLRLATVGLLAWLAFPLGATLDQWVIGGPRFQLDLFYQPVGMVLGLAMLMTGRWVARDLPLALALVVLGFGLKGIFIQTFGDFEVQIWLWNSLGQQVLVPRKWPIHIATTLVGLVGTVGVIWLRRRR